MSILSVLHEEYLPVTTDLAMKLALEHHLAGRRAAAETIYRQILEAEPNHAGALHLLGILAHQAGDNDAAVQLIARAIAGDTSNADFHRDLGDILLAQGKSTDAIASYGTAVSLRPDYADAHFGIGNALSNSGRFADAALRYRVALSFNPGHTDALNNLAVVLQQQGKFEEAVAAYRAALSIRPESTELHYNLGNSLRQLGSLDEAAASYRRATALEPSFAIAHYNLGAVLQHQGKWEEAAEAYQATLAAQPGYADAHYNLGLMRGKQARLADGVDSFRAVLAIRPSDVAANNALGNALASKGELDAAAACYRNAIALKPDYAEGHNNLGNVLHARLGAADADAAIACYTKAIALSPDYAEAHNNLGNVLNEVGRVDEALASYESALALEDFSEFKANFAQCVSGAESVASSPGLRRLVTRALVEAWARPADLSRTAARLAALEPAIGDCVDRANRAWPHRLADAELFGASSPEAMGKDPLLAAVLENSPVCDLSLERFLTMTRRSLLAAASLPASIDQDIKSIAFWCSLARQCFINEYVFSIMEDELAEATRLRERLVEALSRDNPLSALLVVGVASYFPLASIPGAQKLEEREWDPRLRSVLTQQIVEPREEQRLRESITQLTPITEGVSGGVRQQYEENPYPRWIRLPSMATPVSIDAYLRRNFPFSTIAPPTPLRVNALDVLIAGCGTGQEAIETALQLDGASVLAIDLSLSSLAYAKRKTMEADFWRIEYAQADILNLASIGRSFDVISSVGVLHHLEDPAAGLRELASLLRPGGCMRLGLYSERARRTVVAARNYISERGYPSSPSGIRECRAALLEKGGAYEQLSSMRDFYATSECRDLLFHVQERRFSLPAVRDLLAGAGLALVGFLPPPKMATIYRRRFPSDKSISNLDALEIFENEFPDAFIGMYVFWVRKNARVDDLP